MRPGVRRRSAGVGTWPGIVLAGGAEAEGEGAESAPPSPLATTKLRTAATCTTAQVRTRLSVSSSIVDLVFLLLFMLDVIAFLQRTLQCISDVVISSIPTLD
jgi:hypothetical protein